jgi:hypothetical protein
MHACSHNYNIVSRVDHLGSDLAKLLIMMVHGNIWGIGIVLYVPWDTENHSKKRLKAWIDHTELKHDMFTLILCIVLTKL